MLDIYKKALIHVLPYIIPMIVIIGIIGIWTSKIAKKKQQQYLDSMKHEEIDSNNNKH